MRIASVIFIFALILGAISIGFAENTSRTATIIKLKGVAEIKTSKGPWIPAKIGIVLNQGDIVRTKANSFAVLNLDGDAQTATVEVKENSQLRLAEIIEDKTAGTQNTLLDLAVGEILIKAKKLHSERSKFEVKTPTSIVGVRGTTFSVAVEAIE